MKIFPNKPNNGGPLAGKSVYFSHWYIQHLRKRKNSSYSSNVLKFLNNFEILSNKYNITEACDNFCAKFKFQL